MYIYTCIYIYMNLCIYKASRKQMMVDAAGPNFNASEIEDILGFENLPRASLDLYSKAD